MTTFEQLRSLLKQRILIIDGATGTMFQKYHKSGRFVLDEPAFRSTRFANHPKDLKGNNDLLCLTFPEVVEAVHRVFLDVGVDIIETNTFSATSVAQEDARRRPARRPSVVPRQARPARAREAAQRGHGHLPGRRCRWPRRRSAEDPGLPRGRARQAARSSRSPPEARRGPRDL